MILSWLRSTQLKRPTLWGETDFDSRRFFVNLDKTGIRVLRGCGASYLSTELISEGMYIYSSMLHSWIFDSVFYMSTNYNLSQSLINN